MKFCLRGGLTNSTYATSAGVALMVRGRVSVAAGGVRGSVRGGIGGEGGGKEQKRLVL